MWDAVVAVSTTASAGRSQLGQCDCCMCAVLWYRNYTPVSWLQSHDAAATRGVMMCVVYIHQQTTEDSASDVNRTAILEVPPVELFSGLMLLNYIWEVVGSKRLTGSPTILMSLSSFNDLLHLKLGHGSFHPRLSQFAIHWHTRFWLCDFIVGR